MPVKATFLRMPRNPRIPWRQKQRISSKNNTTARHCASVRHQANAASVPRVCLNLKFEDRTHTCYCQFSCASQSELIRTIIHISVNVCVCVCWIIRYLNEVINRVRVSRERERVKFYSFWFSSFCRQGVRIVIEFDIMKTSHKVTWEQIMVYYLWVYTF